MAAGAVKSIQSGTITTLGGGVPVAATITAVVQSKSVISYGGVLDTSGPTATLNGYVELTSATNVNGACGAGVAGNTCVIKFTVVEYY